MAIPHYDQTILPCVQVGGYGFTQEKPMKYLGGTIHKYNPRITATFVSISDANLLALADFYYNDLNSGTLPQNYDRKKFSLRTSRRHYRPCNRSNG